MKKKKDVQLLAIKAARKKSREEEIFLFGHPINYKKVVENKKKYNRKRIKASCSKGDSPYLFTDFRKVA